MSLTVHQSRKLEATARLILIGIIMSGFYVILSDGFTSFFPYINAIIAAFFVVLFISFLEFEIFSEKIKRWKFSYLLILRTFLYSLFIPLIIFSVLLFARVIRYGISWSEVLYSEEFQQYIFQKDFKVAVVYTLGLAFSASFIYQLSKKMGQGVLWGFITGKYHRPIELERIFMFMNIRNSDKIIRTIGLLNFHKLLNDLAYDISPSILAHRGNIYQYVEDELVVSWSMSQGIKNCNCLRAYFDAKEQIYLRREKYFQLYGFVPQFNSAFHCGKVIQGEVGNIKSELAFFGDVMNTTSRIRGQCNQLYKHVLISDSLKKKLSIPIILSYESCGKILLKGKVEEIELWSVEEANLPELD
jgi:adenylate cyclase